MLNGLDLFSGIGGITLALSEFVKPVAYCENDKYAQAVLLSRMAHGDLPYAPIWDDVRTLDGRILFEDDVDIIYGGFPCQDISIAGRGKGLAGERSGLFFEIVRLAKEIKPKFIFLENVPAIRTRGAARVGKELAALGYDCRWDIVSAQEVGAPHIRKRWFLLAYSNGGGLWKERRKEGERTTDRKRSLESYSKSEKGSFTGSPERKIKPFVDRAGDGIPYIVDRNKSLGNAVVPAQVKEAFMRLSGLI